MVMISIPKLVLLLLLLLVSLSTREDFKLLPPLSRRPLELFWLLLAEFEALFLSWLLLLQLVLLLLCWLLLVVMFENVCDWCWTRGEERAVCCSFRLILSSSLDGRLRLVRAVPLLLLLLLLLLLPQLPLLLLLLLQLLAMIGLTKSSLNWNIGSASILATK